MATLMDAAFDRAGPILMSAAPPPPPKPGSDTIGFALAAAGYTLPTVPLPEGNPTDLTIAQLAAGALPAPVPAEPVGQGDLGSSPTLAGIDAAIGAAPLPSAAPIPSAAPTETLLTGIWGVQVGAFSKFAAAHSAALYASQRAPTELQNARVQIEEITNELGTIYRARLIGLDEQGAHDACTQLRTVDQPCIVLKEGDIVAMN
jgi:D-alanyl-D-alanine carboxypeptidase